MNVSARHFCASVSVLAAMLAGAPVLAQAAQDGASDGDAIIVTAQRRDEKSVDVPISVVSLGAEELLTANVNALSDAAKLTPGLRFDTQGPASQPTIRGVGTAITTSGGGPNVGTYVDGFFQPNTYASDLQLLRVKSIQVLKGPQGTLFGRNTTGGAILVTSSDPSTETRGEVRASYGRFNALTVQGYVTGGLTDTLALDLEGIYRRGNGHFADILAKNNKVGKYENWSIRTGLKADLSDGVSLLLRYTHTENSDPTSQLTNIYVDKAGTAGFLNLVSPAGRAIYGAQSSQGRALSAFYFPASTYATVPGQIAKDARTEAKVKLDIIQATLKADLGFANLTSYSQYRTDSTPYYGDLDATAIPAFGIFVGVKDKTISQEFLLNSKPGGPLQWTAGVNYFQYKDTWVPVNASFGGAAFIRFGGSSTTTKSVAAFADLTYEVSDKLFLTVGGRYSHDTVADSYFITNPFTFTYTGPQGQTVCFNATCSAPFPAGSIIPVNTLKNNSFTPRAVLRYKPSEDSSIYASYSKGYKAGILNVGGSSQQPVKPENINAFELGYKYDDRGFSFDAAGFYYDYKNLQVSSFQAGAAQIRNAASSEIYGLEAQFRYRMTTGFTVHAGANWTHARYKSFKNAPYYTWCDPSVGAASPLYCVPIALGGSGPGGIIQTSVDASGFRMQRSPEFSGNVGASYVADLGRGSLTLSGNLYYTASSFADPEQQFQQSGYALASFRAQWEDPSKHYSVAIFGDNITNSRHTSQVLFTTLGIGNVWAQPATWGVQLGAKF